MTAIAKTDCQTPGIAAPLQPWTLPDKAADVAGGSVIHDIAAERREQADARIHARVEGILRDRAQLGRRARHVHATVSDGVIDLYGTVYHIGAACEIEATVRALGRVEALSNRIVTLGARVGD